MAVRRSACSRSTGELQPTFTGLWMAARVEAGSSTGRRPARCAPRAARRRARRRRRQAFVARLDGEAVGFVVLPPSPRPGSSTPRPVAVDQLCVVPRRPPARASARPCSPRCCRSPSALGCEHVATSVPTPGPRRQPVLRPARLLLRHRAPGRLHRRAAAQARAEEPRAGLDELLRAGARCAPRRRGTSRRSAAEPARPRPAGALPQAPGAGVAEQAGDPRRCRRAGRPRR